MLSKSTIIESSHFVVLDRPVSIWEPDGASTNLRFLAGLDPDYFTYQAEMFEPAVGDQGALKGKDSARNAQALRIALGMGLESMFALLAALVQAPHCIFGWMNAYTNRELEEVVARISSGKELLALEPFRSPSWQEISETLLAPLKGSEPEAHRALSAEFAKAWKTLSEVFCHESYRQEYNAMKHGFRTTSSAFSLEFTMLESPSVPFAEYDVPLGQTFPILEKHSSRKGDYSVLLGSVALDPQYCAAALRVVAHSFHNAVQFARLLGGDEPSTLVPSWPSEDAIFRQLERPSNPISSFKYGVNVVPDQYLSKEEVLALYR